MIHKSLILLGALVFVALNVIVSLSIRASDNQDVKSVNPDSKSVELLVKLLEQLPDFKERMDKELAAIENSEKLLDETVTEIKDILEACKFKSKKILDQQQIYYKSLITDLMNINEYDRVHSSPVQCQNFGALVNFVVCIRGREIFLDRLLHSFEEMVRSTNNCNIKIIITNYIIPNPLKNVKESVLAWSRRSGISAEVLELQEKFSKAKGLQTALDTLSDGALACTIDVDMIIPEDYADRIRRHTKQGKTVYSPIVYSLNILQPPKIRGDQKIPRTEFDGEPTGNLPAGGWWRSEGYGNIAYYVSDAKKIGSYEADATKTDWGLEDKNFAQSFQKNGYKLIREEVEGLFHIWHPKSNWEDSVDGL